MLKAKIKGVNSVLQKIKTYAKGKQNEVKKEVARTAYGIENRAKKTVRVDTGRLRSSIAVTFSDGGFNAEVGSNVEYAFDQEFGNPNKPNYSFTPYLTPAFLAERQAFLDNIKKIFSS